MERKTAKSSAAAAAAVAAADTSLPETMRALGARKYTKMSGLEILDVPVPDIQDPKQMLIKMHAAGFATGDANIIAGKMKTLVGDNFKYVLLLFILLSRCVFNSSTYIFYILPYTNSTPRRGSC